MRKIIVFALILVFVGVLVPAFIPHPVCAMTGSGTEGDPYMIYDVDDLQDMSNNKTAYYRLANNIDATNTTNWNVPAGFMPIGSQPQPFSGDFDGNGYYIWGLYIFRFDYVGLFGYVQNATIQDVALIYFVITGDDSVGTLAGYCRDSTVSEVTVYSCNLTGDDYCGGLIGQARADTITRCITTGNLIVGDYSGGLIGQAHTYNDVGNNVSECFSACAVTATGNYIGGLVGQAYHLNLDRSYATGDVSGDLYIAGLVGQCGGDDNDIDNCYARGSAVADSYVAGLIAQLGTGSTVNSSYSTGEVLGNTDVSGCVHDVDGVTNCFWDTQASGQSSSLGGTGKTTTQMTTESTFTNAGWDFDTIWGMSESVNDGYPYLQWRYPWEGDWEDYDIYQVLWFQPNDLIYGTTLPDRMENQDGDITWGTNPAGIVIDVGSLVSAIQPTPWVDTEEPGIRDALPEAEAVNWFIEPDMGALATNPLRPFVTILSDNSTLTEWQAWRYLGLIFVIFCTALAAWKLRGHLFIAGVTCALAMAILVQQTIWPLWTVVFIVAAIVAGLIAERTPQV